jgi:hypothetical protein
MAENPFEKQAAALELKLKECYTGKLHWLIWIFALTIMPLVMVSTVWSHANNYPFGNHDAGFHYARTLGNQTVYEQYFGPLNSKYYEFYPPLTAFVFSIGLRFIPLTPVLAFNVIGFIILTAIMWLFHYYTKSDLATFLLFTSGFMLGYFMTYARMLFIVLLLVYMIFEKYRASSSLLISITHNAGLWFFIAGNVGDWLLKIDRKVEFLAIKLLGFGAVIYGVFFRPADLAFMPVLFLGFFFIEVLDNFELMLLIAATLGYLFVDQTISLFMALILAIAFSRSTCRYLPGSNKKGIFSPVPSRFYQKLMFTIIIMIMCYFFVNLLILSSMFLQTSVATLGFNFQFK